MAMRGAQVESRILADSKLAVAVAKPVRERSMLAAKAAKVHTNISIHIRMSMHMSAHVRVYTHVDTHRHV